MLAEFVDSIEAIFEKKVDAKNKVAIMEIPGHPMKSKLIINADGSFDEYNMPASPRRSRIYSLTDVGRFAKHARDKWSCSPSIYFNERMVTVQLQDESITTNPEAATFDLEPSKEFATLKKWLENTTWLSQKEFIRELRTTLAACFDPDRLSALVSVLSELEFSNADRVQSVVERNRNTMGKEILSEIRSNKGVVPERVFLNVPVFEEELLSSPFSIECLLETDPSVGRIALIPNPANMRSAVKQKLDDLRTFLENSVEDLVGIESPKTSSDEEIAFSPKWSIPVFHGTCCAS